MLQCLLIVSGCGDSPAVEARGQMQDVERVSESDTLLEDSAAPGEEIQWSQDSLFAYLHDVDAAAVLAAFEALSNHAYTKYVRTEQFNREGYRIAYRERIVDVERDSSTVRARDSSGAFDYGYLRLLTSDEIEAGDPATVAENIIPDDPAYLSARNREAYKYAMTSDTLPGHGAVDVVEVRADPDEGGDQTIRHATLYLEKGVPRLVAMRVQRMDAALWFQEFSDLYVSIRPGPSNNSLPHQARIETHLRMPFRPIQRFRTVLTFYRYR